VGYRGQSCADHFWQREYVNDISFKRTKIGHMFSASPLVPWDQQAYEEALERGELAKYVTLFDDLCADREFCAAHGYAPEDSLGRRFSAPAGSPRDGAADAATERDRYETLYRGPGLESLVWSGRCWEVHEARDGWSDPAHAPSDLSAWRRCCCKVLLDIPLMMAKRDLDVPTACQASPRGVSTKAIV
jgi:hypothetical protein